MRKIFIACDSSSVSEIRKIISTIENLPLIKFNFTDIKFSTDKSIINKKR